MGLFWEVSKGFAAGYTVGSFFLDPRRFVRKLFSSITFLLIMPVVVLSEAQPNTMMLESVPGMLEGCFIIGCVFVPITVVSVAKFFCIRPFWIFQVPKMFRQMTTFNVLAAAAIMVAIALPFPIAMLGFNSFWWLFVLHVALIVYGGWGLAHVDAKIAKEVLSLADSVGRIIGVDPNSLGLEITDKPDNPLYTFYFPMLLKGAALQEAHNDLARLLPGATIEAITEQGVDVRVNR